MKSNKFILSISFIVILFSVSKSFAVESLNKLENQLTEENINIIRDNINDIEDNTGYNSALRVLRLNREGLSPAFNPNETEYYLVVDSTVNNINITAIPQNDKSIVTITGNTNLNLGRNMAVIKVESENGIESSEYKIYITKTENIESANANLEMLAIREGYLSPEFDFNITKYRIEVPENTNKIELFAVPQSQKAIINILGNDTLNIGDNKVKIEVLAEDRITIKNYEINVYRRNEVEENKNTEEQAIAKRIVASIHENQIQKSSINDKGILDKEGNLKLWIAFTAIILIFSGLIIYRKRFRKK